MLLDELPAWAAVFGIRPWELDHLTDAEVAVFRLALPRGESANGPR